MKLFLRIKDFFIKSYRRGQIEATEKMLDNIRFDSDNYDVDSKIRFLDENDIRIKYKVFEDNDLVTHNYNNKDNNDCKNVKDFDYIK